MTPAEILYSWATVNKYMPSATEEELNALLEEERRTSRRLTVMLRIYGRLNKLRTQRERNELIKWSLQ